MSDSIPVPDSVILNELVEDNASRLAVDCLAAARRHIAGRLDRQDQPEALAVLWRNRHGISVMRWCGRNAGNVLTLGASPTVTAMIGHFGDPAAVAPPTSLLEARIADLEREVVALRDELNTHIREHG